MDVDGRRPVRKRQVDQLEKAGRRRPAEKDRLKKAGRRRPVEKGSGRCQPGKKKQDGRHRPRKGLWRRRRPSMVNIYRMFPVNSSIYLYTLR